MKKSKKTENERDGASQLSDGGEGAPKQIGKKRIRPTSMALNDAKRDSSDAELRRASVERPPPTGGSLGSKVPARSSAQLKTTPKKSNTQQRPESAVKSDATAASPSQESPVKAFKARRPKSLSPAALAEWKRLYNLHYSEGSLEDEIIKMKAEQDNFAQRVQEASTQVENLTLAIKARSAMAKHLEKVGKMSSKELLVGLINLVKNMEGVVAHLVDAQDPPFKQEEDTMMTQDAESNASEPNDAIGQLGSSPGVEDVGSTHGDDWGNASPRLYSHGTSDEDDSLGGDNEVNKPSPPHPDAQSDSDSD